jgi:hypothetical protein
MKKILITGLIAPALLGGCSDKKESIIIKGVAPTPIVESAGKSHGVVLSTDSGGEAMGGDYAHRTWNYFSREKSVTDDSLKAIVKDATEGIRSAVIEMGGRVEPVGAWSGYFQIQSFDYSHHGKRGTVRVTAGVLERGTAVTVIAEERPR